MTALLCSDCDLLLAQHCDSPTCHWLKCGNVDCDWVVYDVERGARADKAGNVERL